MVWSPLGWDSPFKASEKLSQKLVLGKVKVTPGNLFLSSLNLNCEQLRQMWQENMKQVFDVISSRPRDLLWWLASAEANISGSTVMPSRQTDRSPTTSIWSLSAHSCKVCTTSETTNNNTFQLLLLTKAPYVFNCRSESKGIIRLYIITMATSCS